MGKQKFVERNGRMCVCVNEKEEGKTVTKIKAASNFCFGPGCASSWSEKWSHRSGQGVFKQRRNVCRFLLSAIYDIATGLNCHYIGELSGRWFLFSFSSFVCLLFLGGVCIKVRYKKVLFKH